MKNMYKMIVICLMIIFAAAAAGCNLGDSANKPVNDPGVVTGKTPDPPPVNNSEMVDVKVYFGTKDAMHIQAEVYPLKRDANLMRRAMEILVAGPKQAEHIALIPPGTKVRAVNVKDRTASVDFTGEILKRGGGSAMEMLAVGAIVNTLTEFQDIEKVQILVEGRKVSTLFGHMDVSEAMGRSPAIIKK